MDRFGTFGAIVAGLAVGSCCLGVPAALVVSGLGLGFLANGKVGLPVLYALVALVLGGTYVSYRRNKEVAPLIIAPIGAGLVLYPFHFLTQLWLFRALLFGGLGLLVISSIWGLVVCRKEDASCSYRPVQS